MEKWEFLEEELMEHVWKLPSKTRTLTLAKNSSGYGRSGS